MRDALRSKAVLAAMLLSLGAAPASACPLCRSATGERVRAAIFGPDFGYHLAVTLLPFPVLLGIVALVHFGPPRPSRRPRKATSDRTAEARP